MANLNQCNFTGRLGADPELRYFPDGTAVCNISIAVSRKYKDKQSGELNEITTWPSLVFIGRVAEILNEYAKKGDLIRVSAEYRSRKYQNQDKQDRWAHEFKVYDLELLGSRGQGDSRTASQQDAYGQGAGSAKPADGPAPTGEQYNDNFDEDIPFS